MNAELLRRSRRLLRIDMTTPQFLTRTTALTPDTRRVTAKERRAAWRHGRRSRDAVPTARSMSGDGRCAGAKEGAVGSRQVEFGGSLELQSPENAWQRKRRDFGRHQCARQMDERADRAAIVGERLIAGRVRMSWCGVAVRLRMAHGPGVSVRCDLVGCDFVGMDVSERHDELEGQRQQRQPRTPSRARSEPVHRRHARHISTVY